jgi:hypothetical protein
MHIRAFSSAGSEHLPYKQRVGGSNPSTPTYLVILQIHFGRLAQLVQSICLTSRGSGVRIPQRPQKKVVQEIVRLFFVCVYFDQVAFKIEVQALREDRLMQKLMPLDLNSEM